MPVNGSFLFFFFFSFSFSWKLECFQLAERADRTVTQNFDKVSKERRRRQWRRSSRPEKMDFAYRSRVVVSNAITCMDEMGTDDGFFNATMGAY